MHLPNIMPTWNPPIVCAVLALDSWNYCSQEQAQQPNICQIAQSSLYSWTMYILIKDIMCCHLMLNCPATRWHQGFHFLLINEAMQGKHWEESVGPALWSNSFTCLVLILHRQLGNYLLSNGESYSPTYGRLNISQCLTLTKRRPTHWCPAQHAVQSPGAHL